MIVKRIAAPATEKQVNMLLNMGYVFNRQLDKFEAMELIDKLKRQEGGGLE